MPRAELRQAFANGATHVIFWKKVGPRYVVRGDYVLPERLRALRQTRGDQKSYTSESEEMVSDAICHTRAHRPHQLSRALSPTVLPKRPPIFVRQVIDANGAGPIATAARSGKEVVIEDADSGAHPNYRRADLAKEFGVRNVHFVPTEAGVLEYGSASTSAARA